MKMFFLTIQKLVYTTGEIIFELIMIFSAEKKRCYHKITRITQIYKTIFDTLT